MPSLSDLIAQDFQTQGALARSLPGYVHREGQAALASEIAACMERGGCLLAEAETGTGKTLAYLVPVLRSVSKVLVSTHTKALQDQLMHRDIPALKRALGARRRIALLKGRGNYLCPYRLEKHLRGGQAERRILPLLLKVKRWAEKSRDGDLSGLDFDVHNAGIGSMVTATAEQCLGGRCPRWNDCPLVKARQAAQEADLVVCNHSLVLADAELKAGAFGEVLPDFDCLIFDEAHSLPELACRHFGRRITIGVLSAWYNDMQDMLVEWGDESELQKRIDRHFLAATEAYAREDLRTVLEHWRSLAREAESRSERSEEAARLAARAAEIAADLEAVLQPPAGYVAWQEDAGKQARHLLAPIETGPVLAEKLWSRSSALILLSATLRVSGSFQYAVERLGLGDAQTAFHPSPFDYTRQAMIYVPRHLPAPNEPGHLEALVDEAEALIRASNGRAFVLFTSHRMLRLVAPRLGERLPWPVLVQDESGSKDTILHIFRKDTHSVLCGTRSFWEGVDVPGEALSLVVIDKLPFAPPDDKLLLARRRRCEEKGGNGFFDIQLPEAVAVLRQGVGRLIRTSRDRGVIAILDSRLHRKSYGRIIAANLPPAPKTEDLDEVRAFFRAA